MAAAANDIDIEPPPAADQRRAGGAQERADVDAAPPVGRVDLVDTSGWAGNAGIVDQRVSRRAFPSQPQTTGRRHLRAKRLP
jgi:hypothetical protein